MVDLKLRAYLTKAKRTGDVVILYYSDNDIVIVKYEDYNRALATMINSDKEDIIRDFAIKLNIYCEWR